MIRFARFGAMLLVMLLLCSMLAPVYASEKIASPDISFKAPKKGVFPGANTGIEVDLSSPGFLTVKLADEGGNVLKTIVDNLERPSGEYMLPWDGTLDGGVELEKGTYYLLGLLRNEMGEESKERKQKITVHEPAPKVENLTFTQGSGEFAWTFTFDTDESPKSFTWVDLHSARDIDHAMQLIISADHDGGRVTVGWDTVVSKTEEQGKATWETIYPGRYAVRVYTKNKEDIESDPATLYITVENGGRTYLADAEGNEIAGAAPPQTAAIEEGDEAGADAAGDPAVADEPAAADDTAAAGDGEAAVISDAVVPAGEGAPVAANRVQLGQPVGSVALVSPEAAQVGKGVSDYVEQPADNYWNLETGSMDDAAIWNALIKPMYVCKIGESEHFYLLDKPDKKGKRLGEMHGETAAVNVLYENKDGWALAEGYDNEDGAFIRGWVQMSRLREVTPDQEYGLVLDKRSQTLTLYHQGQQVDTIKVSTGLADAKNKVRETPAGEFVLGTRIGTKEQGVLGTCDYHIRIQGGILMHGQPYKGDKKYEWGDKLGTKSTRNTIVVQSEPNAGQTFCMENIWSQLPRNMKILILDDKPRSEVPFKK